MRLTVPATSASRNDGEPCLATASSFADFKPEVRDSSLEKNETSSDAKPPLPRGLRQQLRDVEHEILARDIAKARKKRGTIVIEEDILDVESQVPCCLRDCQRSCRLNHA
jgi:hypothetical protein